VLKDYKDFRELRVLREEVQVLKEREDLQDPQGL
jgi:hypothetical protein